MIRFITVHCPECGYPAMFNRSWVAEEDALMLIDVDGRACRRCGARLIKVEEEG